MLSTATGVEVMTDSVFQTSGRKGIFAELDGKPEPVEIVRRVAR